MVLTYLLILRGGQSATGCSATLPPLAASTTSAEDFRLADIALQKMATAASAGDLDGADKAFFQPMGNFGPVHDFSHAVDPVIRQKDVALGKRLCEKVLEIEKEFALDRRPAMIADLAQQIRQIIAAGARELGYDSSAT